MQTIDSWQLKGKLAYRNDSVSGSAWFDWSQHGDKFTIYLSGPFGVGTVQISGNAQVITLSQPGEPDISSHSSSALTQRLFGWQLPVEQMRSWVRGIPASPSSGVIKTFNEEGLLDSLQENDWQLTISRYQTGPRGQVPGKIKGRSDKLAFTLLLKEWSFPERNPQHSTSNPSHSLDK
jgi:outer membrane lipoprotein LolB